MMTTDSPPRDIEAGIGWLKEGKTFPFEGVVFFLDRSSSSPVLNVDSYSSCIHLENIQESEAQEKIGRSKKVGDYLAGSFPAFAEVWSSMRKRFGFCYDYGTGAVMVASEQGESFQWHKK
jgi:hypothetical protein